jgi:hypothetical protein
MKNQGVALMVKGRNAAQLLTPLLDLYKDEPIAIVGCHSQQIERDVCEYDVIVVGEKNAPKTLSFGAKSFEIFFVEEKELLNPKDPELSISFSSMIILRDTTFQLSTAYSFHRTMVEKNSKISAERRLARSLKCLARSEEAFEKGFEQDSGFWLAYSSYNFLYAWLLLKNRLPAPSHLIEQLKKVAKYSPNRFEAISRGISLNRSNRQTCLERLHTLNIVMDTLENSPSSQGMYVEDFNLIKRKVDYLISNMMFVECFSFLGFKICEYILSLITATAKSEIDYPLNFLSEKTRLISKDVTRKLHLTSTKEELRHGISEIKEQIQRLARTV